MEKYYRSGFMQLSFAKMQGGFICSRFGYSVNASQIIGREGTIITLYKKIILRFYLFSNQGLYYKLTTGYNNSKH